MEITMNEAVFGGFSFPEHLSPMQTWNGWMVGHWPFVTGIHKCMGTWLSLIESINQINHLNRGSILLYLADKFDKDGKFFPKDGTPAACFGPWKVGSLFFVTSWYVSINFFLGVSLDTSWEWLSNPGPFTNLSVWKLNLLRFVSATLF